VPNIFSEDNAVGNYIPAITFAFLYTQNPSLLLFGLFVYSVLVGTHRIIIKHRTDTPEDYSMIGKIISGIPLFLLYPIGLIKLSLIV
jgi:hypothetical protein